MTARRKIAVTALALALAWAPLASAKDSAAAADSASTADGADATRVEVGQSAPDFTLPDPEGADHALSSLKGEKNVLLVFFRGAW